ncbi:kinase-like domain-containing protein [Gigaspora rosea]|uniref:Kinase-like domain-containing protein n=1 Tax=Gigaspora rosea TaxID=44941 RepID=A0A397U1X5_9GLOM|nr:kinase-like domain-containing protein [Gigaspora rosea]
MEWKHKLTLLHCIASDLQIIHSHELIHRDLHSGNILVSGPGSAYIADLGLSISTSIALKGERHGVYGVLPFIAPEVLDKGQYTTASDIYSIGIIMWEILYGKSAVYFYNQKNETQLQIEICKNDLRPPIIENIPQCYISLMKKCWEREPTNRPSAIEICEILTEWQNDESILSELIKSDEILNVLIDERFENMNILETSDDIYKSKFIEYTTSLYRDSGLNELKIP